MSHPCGKLACAALLALAACEQRPANHGPPPADLVVTGATVHDGQGGAPFVGDLVVRAGRFVAVGPDAAQSFTAARTIDAAGLHAVPGLWDMHAHLRSSNDGGLDPAGFLEHGVTSVRDLGGIGSRVQDVLESDTTRPALYPSFEMLNGESFGPFQRVVDRPESVRAAVADLADRGATQVKIHRALKPALLPHVVEAAAAHGLDVVGHIPLGMHPLEACEAGMGGIEHIAALVESVASVHPGMSNAEASAWLLSNQAEPVYECLAERGVYVTPTLVVYWTIGRSRFGHEADWPEEARQALSDIQAVTLRLHESGVPLLAGTDASDLDDALSIPAGASLVSELEELQAAGIPTAAVLAMATANAAEASGRSGETGALVVGTDADFLLLEHDPLEDLAHLRDPVGVYQEGRRVAGRPQID